MRAASYPLDLLLVPPLCLSFLCGLTVQPLFSSKCRVSEELSASFDPASIKNPPETKKMQKNCSLTGRKKLFTFGKTSFVP
jgi:hypothetical protein